MTMIPNPVRISHITSINNLPGIIALGGLLSTHALTMRGIVTENIAYLDIQSRRDVFPVPCGPQGTLHDYVPWMFAPRSPMLCTISHGNVPGVSGQNNIIYLVSTINEALRSGQPFVFSDGHPTVFPSKFYDDLAYLDEINWEVMRMPIWRNTQQAPHRKRLRQAEFLVHEFFPWESIIEIGVIDEYRLNLVKGIVRQAEHQPRIYVKKKWYY